MNFQTLPVARKGSEILDTAIKAAKKDVSGRKFKGETRLSIAKQKEERKFLVLEAHLSPPLLSLIKAYPNFENLSEFYTQLVRTTIDRQATVAALASAHWAVQAIRTMRQDYVRKIRGARNINDCTTHARAGLGRIASILKRIEPHLKQLNESRKVMLMYPDVRDGIIVAIAGFPNVGKSTLLSKLSPAKPKIAPYAFTTTTLNAGSIRIGSKTIQLIDTPGTLNRLDTMNTVEKVAWLALRYGAHAIIFVADPTESYPLQEQQDLYRKIVKLDKPMLVYVSKSDIANIAPMMSIFNGALTSPDDVLAGIIKICDHLDI